MGGAIQSIGADGGCRAETLRATMRQTEYATSQLPVIVSQLFSRWVRTVGHARRNLGIAAPRCSVVRLINPLDLAGVICRRAVRTRGSDKAGFCRQSRLNRQLGVLWPDGLWVSDFTVVHPGQG